MKRQVSVLSTVSSRLAARFSAALSFSTFYPSANKPGLESLLQQHLELLSLHGAFEWLRINYLAVYDLVAEMISEDQDEPLPLNWAALVEDWDHTYWVVWIFIVWMLWAREGEGFRLRHASLSLWLLDMNRSNTVRVFQGPCTFHTDQMAQGV